MKRPVEDGLSLLVGAGVGMALMYLLDPAEGSERREHLHRAARERLAQAGTAASAGLEHLHGVVDRAAHAPAIQQLAAHAADAAKGIYNDIGGHASAVASDYQKQASDAAQGVRSTISGKIDELRDKASGLKETARSRYGDWLNRSSLALGRDEDHHYVGQTACALGSLAIGAGAVYLFDPDQGQQRRAKIVGGTTHAVRETGEFFRKAGRRLATRGRVAARAASEHARGAVSSFRSTGSEAQPAHEPTDASIGT
jgi:gas vesicle protein